MVPVHPDRSREVVLCRLGATSLSSHTQEPGVSAAPGPRVSGLPAVLDIRHRPWDHAQVADFLSKVRVAFCDIDGGEDVAR